MAPPDLYRSEAFAEDLPEGGYEPLALRPTGFPGVVFHPPRGLWRALRAALTWRRGTGAAVHAA